MTLLDMATVVAMSRWWWTFILRGVVAVGFGILAFFAPGWGVLVLVALFGIWALIEGISAFFTGLRTRGANRNWWLELLVGVLSITAGLLALIFPGFASGILLILIAAWAIVIGLFQISMAIRLRDEIRGEFWLGLAGVAAIILGVSMFLFPTAGILGLVWLIGSLAIVFGVFLIVLGWRLRAINELVKRDAATDYSTA